MRFLAFILFIAFLLFAVFARWYFICDILYLCQEEIIEQPDTLRLQTLQLTEDDSVLLSGYDQFFFEPNTFTAEMTANNEQFLDTVFQLLSADSTKDLQITGKYALQEGEIMAGFYETLGFARAAAVREMMIKRGTKEERIILKDLGLPDSLVKEPILFELVSNQAVSEYANAPYLFTNMTYSNDNFPSNGDVFDPEEAFLNYADSLKTYMELNPDKSIRIIGHTDNVDSERYNQKLGLRRAKSAQEYLQNFGINCAFVTESKGETEPVETNSTDEGRQKNRRVNFVIE